MAKPSREFPLTQDERSVLVEFRGDKRAVEPTDAECDMAEEIALLREEKKALILRLIRAKDQLMRWELLCADAEIKSHAPAIDCASNRV